MAKNKKLGTQFPRIYRLITERSGFLIFLASSFFVISLIFLLILQFTGNYEKYASINSQKIKIYSQINFWNSVLDKFPGFADASFNIAVLYFKAGDLDKARLYLEKTLLYDPGYEKIEELRQLLDNH